MGRWEPDAESRFRAAAIELFGEIGYDQTTVAAIAERAGLTARTFFRYFADKRYVRFSGSAQLQQMMVDGLVRAPADVPAIEAIAAALMKAGEFFHDDRRPLARQRSTVIAANRELRERELSKLSALAEALAQALRERGVAAVDASLAAEAGMAVFRVAFEQWVGESDRRSYATIVHESMGRLKLFATG